MLHREKFTTTTIGSFAPEAEVDHDRHCLAAPAMQPRWPLGQMARSKPGGWTSVGGGRWIVEFKQLDEYIVWCGDHDIPPAVLLSQPMG